MGIINWLLQEWKSPKLRHAAKPLTLPPSLQRVTLDFMKQELVSAKAFLESSLFEQCHEMTDRALENELRAAYIEERIDADTALRTPHRARNPARQGNVDRLRTCAGHA
jgi:hypothetical protein